jgi:hypothetical protein
MVIAATAALGFTSIASPGSVANADPVQRAEPVLCQLAPPSGTNPQTGAIVGATGTPRPARVDNQGAVSADLSATCFSNQDVFFRFRITRARDGRQFNGTAWMRLVGADCARPAGCTRNLVSSPIKIGGNNTGNDEWSIQFLDAAGNVTGTAGVYPTSFLPPVFPPSSAPLQSPEVISIPALF